MVLVTCITVRQYSVRNQKKNIDAVSVSAPHRLVRPTRQKSKVQRSCSLTSYYLSSTTFPIPRRLRSIRPLLSSP